MDYFKLYNKIKYYYEDRFDSKNTTIFKKIIEELLEYNKDLNKTTQFLYINYEGIFNTLHMQIWREQKDIGYFYQLLEKYQYHFFHTILWCISDICNAEYEKTEQYWIHLYLYSPFIFQITKENNIYKIDSILGNIEFQKAKDYFQEQNNPYLRNLVISKKLVDYCHESTLVVTKNIKDSFACTTLCRQAFVGYFYHSVVLHRDNCIDINSGSVIPFHQFETLTNAKVLEKIPHNELQEKTHPFSKYGSELLYNTLHNQLHNIKIKKILPKL